MLCALLGAPRLIVPAALWDALTSEQRDTLLVHELAHLRRRDHWVRRLEFVVTLLYWWHPVLWWARREIEEAEEQCCDAWVVSLSPAGIPAYAEALVATITFLSQAHAALPLGASGMGHAHSLRRRLTMIMRGTTPKGLSAAGMVAVVVLGAAALPLLPTWGQTAASAIDSEKNDGSPNTGNARYQEQAVGVQPAGITRALAPTGGQNWQTQEHRATSELEAAEDQVDLLRAQLQAKQAEMGEGKARYQQAQRELEIKERQFKANSVSKEELDQARLETQARGAVLQGKEAQVKEAEVRLRQAQRLLARLRAQREQPRVDHLIRPIGSGAMIPGRGSSSSAPEGRSAGAGAIGPNRSSGVAEQPAHGKKVQFQAHNQPWPATLDWLAQQTGLPIIANSVPDGTFTVFGSTSEKYTIPQVVDMLNGQLKLQKQPMLLIRGKHDFQLIPLDPTKLDPTSLPRVTKSELDQHGDTELVILELPLETLNASDVARELAPNNVPANRKLLGPLGQVVVIPGTNHLILRDTVQTLRNIVHFLDDAEEFEKKKGGVFKHKCIYVRAKDAERILKDLLGIAASPPVTPGQPGQPGNARPATQGGASAARQQSVHVSADEVSNTVFVSGPPDKIDLAKKTLAEFDVPRPGQPNVMTGPPTVRTYKVPGGNAKEIQRALKELYQGRDIKISPIGQDSIVISALPDDQEAIAKYLQGANKEAVFEAIPLFTLEAKKVYDNLKTLFDVGSATAPTLDVDIPRNLILVRGTKEQVTAVKEALKKLGTDTSQRNGSRRVPAAEIEKALKQNRLIRDQTAQIAALEESLLKSEQVYADNNHPKLRDTRQKIMKAHEELRQLRQRLIPVIRQQLADHYELLGEPESPDKEQRLEQVEKKLDKLLSEVEALRKSRTEPQREGRPR
jgi:type II secretory pathway component GspD/PulD (secretin)